MKRITNLKTRWDVLGEAYNAVYRLQEIADSSNQSKAIKLRNAEKYFPGLLAAIIDTLKQPNLTSEKRKRWTNNQ